MHVIGEHPPSVQALTFSADGRRLASAGKDGTARVWNLAAGGEPLVLTGHQGPILALAFHPTADILVSASADATICWWDLPTASPKMTFIVDNQIPATAVAFLDSGNLFVYASGNRINSAESGQLIVWNPATQQSSYRRGEPAGVWAVSARLDAKQIAWAGGSKRVTVWDVTRQDHLLLPPMKTGVGTLALAPDGSCVAAGENESIRVWSVADRQEQPMLAGHKGRVSSLAFSPDSRTLASGGWDRRVIFWDIASSTMRQSFDWGVGRVLALGFAPDGLIAAAAGDNGRVVVWDLE
ncbi:MAG: WD40 repeat domain-containing protein [Gemmataceae bacterium]